MGAVPVTLERGLSLQRHAKVWAIVAHLAAMQTELDRLRREVAELSRMCDAELERVERRKTRKRRP